MGFVFKIAVTIFLMWYIKSCSEDYLTARIDNAKREVESRQEPSKSDVQGLLNKILSFEWLNGGKTDSFAEKPEPMDTTERIRVASPVEPKRGKSNSHCEVVQTAHGKSLVSNPSEIRNLEVPVTWRAVNNTNQTIAILINQDGKDVAVAFLGPRRKYESRIPASALQFSIRRSQDACINWRVDQGVFTRIPIPTEMPNYTPTSNTIELYRNAIFQTEVNTGFEGVTVETKLIGFMNNM